MDTPILTSLTAILTAISSLLDRLTQMLVPPTDTLTTRSSLMGILTAISSPLDRSIQTLLPPEGDIDNLDDNNQDENFLSPVSSTNLSWEMSQDGSDHESSDDFVMSGDSDDESFSSES